VSEFLLIRHAVNDFVKTGRLAGWTPGVHLNEDGRAQAEALGERLARTRIDALYSSPLERTVETAQAVLAHHPELQLSLLEDVGEVRYGTWQGAEVKSLVQRKMWRVIQINPSRARFPGGESLREAQMRAVNAIEMLNDRHPRSTIAVVSHSDIIKMIVAHFLGVHLDLFQRIDVSPASLTVLQLGYGRPVLVQLNEASYLPPPRHPQHDERHITTIRPATALTLDALGEPGARAFFLQAAGQEVAPVTFALEKTQALMLAGQIEALLAPIDSAAAHSTQPAPPLAAPEALMFRAGGFTLKYEDAGGLICLVVTEMLGEGQGAPRTIDVWATPGQMHSLAVQARAVAARGRQSNA
jgi:probable phosphoglycerate mutase